ncbi:MAG: thioredoxin-dependent thiol peroxidase [Deltaproteobacteria bacterium]
MTNLKKGDNAPDFTGIDQNKKEIKLTDLKGSKLILYFYPKDFTSGCTVEAENLNSEFYFWKKNNFRIIGVSPDSADSHCKFREKYNLQFDLIADTDHSIATAYGVYGKKKMYGREYMGIMRTTFVIDQNGIIEEVITDVKTKDHSNQIIKTLNLN